MLWYMQQSDAADLKLFHILIL